MSWEPANLRHIEPRPKTRPTLADVGLLYPGKRHLFSGPPESAKTLAAYIVAIEVVRRGGNVLLIDFEMGPWDALDRLREMGATDDDLDRVFYVEPDTPPSEEITERLAADWTLSLVIIDAAAGAYDLASLDDGKRKDVERFARMYVRAFHSRSVATLVIDHVTKNEETRGRFAIGSERKLGGVDVHIGFEIIRSVARGKSGLYKLMTHKDRLGHLPRPKAADLELRSHPATHAITWTFREPARDEAPAWKPTVLMEKVSRYLVRRADEVPRSEVEKNVTGAAEFVRLALDELIASGHVAERKGSHGARLNRSVRPFRESDLVGTSSEPRRDEDNPPSSSSSSDSRPVRGDDDELGVDEDEIERLAAVAREVQT